MDGTIIYVIFIATVAMSGTVCYIIGYSQGQKRLSHVHKWNHISDEYFHGRNKSLRRKYQCSECLDTKSVKIY